jgi:hypothetical protein
MIRALAVAACLAATACSTSGQTVAKIDAAVVALTTAERVALIYTSMPRCTAPPTTTFCSSPSVVAEIKSLNMTAYTAVKAAEANSAVLQAALDAIGNFQSAIPKPGN